MEITSAMVDDPKVRITAARLEARTKLRGADQGNVAGSERAKTTATVRSPIPLGFVMRQARRIKLKNRTRGRSERPQKGFQNSVQLTRMHQHTAE